MLSAADAPSFRGTVQSIMDRDLPDQHRASLDSATPPVRIMAPFDNRFLSHVDRSRIMDEQYRTRVFTVNGTIKPVVLVHGRFVGFVGASGSWERRRRGNVARLTVSLCTRQTKTALSSIEREGRLLLGFMHPAISNREVSSRPSSSCTDGRSGVHPATMGVMVLRWTRV